jgi:hypothetical protein
MFILKVVYVLHALGLPDIDLHIRHVQIGQEDTG